MINVIYGDFVQAGFVKRSASGDFITVSCQTTHTGEHIHASIVENGVHAFTQFDFKNVGKWILKREIEALDSTFPGWTQEAATITSQVTSRLS